MLKKRNQITLYYNPATSSGLKTLALLKQSQYPVLALDINKESPTPSMWLKIARDLNVEIHELVLREHPAYRKKYRARNMGPECWLKIMQNEPEVIAQPIAFKGNQGMLVKTPTDILHLINT